jgi:arylsulfatase A-like enzyme
MTGLSSTREAGTPLGRLCLAVLALTAAQVIVAFAMRWLLWSRPPLAIIRAFMVHDLAVIAGFAAAGLALALLAHRWRAARVLVMGLAWSLGVLHCGLLAANYLAVTWLRAPLTWAWIETADLGRSATPWLMARSVVTPGALAGFVAALLLPAVLLLIARRLPARLRAAAPWGLALAAAGCTLLAATGNPARPDQWRDAVTSPAAELWVSLQRNEFRQLMEQEGDGMTRDYALRPAAPAPAPSAAPPRRDILVVLFESVGARAVRDNLDRLPTIARLAREGTTFRNATVPVSTSTRSLFALMFSRYPRLSYTAEPHAVESGYPELFLRTLRRGGYATMFVKGGDFAFESQDIMLEGNDPGPMQDYSTLPCDHRVDRSTARSQNQVWLSDRCTYAAIERWFAAAKAPRAGIVLPVSTHFPYDYEKGGAARPGSREAYVDALVQSDRLLGEMLNRLAKRGIRPLVVILGDHGEAFGEHGVVMHGQSMFEEETAIPLILAGPGIPAGKVDDRLASMLDIAPTLTEYAGLPRPCGWQGLSLLGAERRGRAYAMAFKRRAYAGYREGNAKFVFDMRDQTIVRYDLAADPDERRPQPVTGAEAGRVKAAIAGWARYNAALYNHGDGPCRVPPPG